jgi:hypothetical protein
VGGGAKPGDDEEDQKDEELRKACARGDLQEVTHTFSKVLSWGSFFFWYCYKRYTRALTSENLCQDVSWWLVSVG